jgi:RNA polymerase sigma factor (sigma-70 family)
MSALQTYLSNHRAKPGPQPLSANVRKRKTRGNAARIPASPRPEKAVPPAPVSEEWTLIQRAIAGNSCAQQLIFSRYTAKLQRSAFAILRNKEDAEDAVQDGLCRAYANLRSFQGRSSLSTWLTRIVINSALMLRRRKGSRPEASLDDILTTQPERLAHRMIDKRPNPEETYKSAEFFGLLEAQVRRLSPGLRASIQLCAFDGLSQTESMEVLGVQKSTFKSRISRARQKLVNGLRQCIQPPRSAPRFGERFASEL